MVYRFITGGYAAPEKPGVCVFSFDPEMGFTLERSWKGFINPSYLVKHPRLPVLYTVEETSPMGKVCAWEMRGEDLRALDSVPSGGGDPCHLTLSPDVKRLYVSNYGSGTLAAFSLDEAGRIAEMTDLKRHSGHGPNPSRQEGPHIHCSMEHAGTLYVCDLGLDCIKMYRETESGLSFAGDIAFKAGSGPRHVIASEKLPGHLYCVTELAGSVCHMVRRGDCFEILQDVSALPADFPGQNTAAAIRFALDGKYLLTSNRGHDSIAVFPVDGEGNLGQMVLSPCVAEPRDFAVFDEWVIAGSQRDNEIRAYRLDKNTLKLTDTGLSASADRPTCFFRL